MDLPTCPACGQSVLDDDAEECPFCGASMSGKPSKKKTSPAAAAAPVVKAKQPPKAAPPKSESTKPDSPRKSSKPDSPKDDAAATKISQDSDDDDPFDIDTTASQRAIPLSPKPSKGRLHRVFCPMCETPGFTTKKAAGKEVKCSNPDCLVPLFTAPPLEVKEKEVVEEPEPPTKRLSLGVLIGLVGLLAVVVGGIVIFVFKQDQPPSDGPGPPPSLADNDLKPTNPGGETDPNNKKEDEPKPVVEEVPTLTPTEIRDLAR